METFVLAPPAVILGVDGNALPHPELHAAETKAEPMTQQ